MQAVKNGNASSEHKAPAITTEAFSAFISCTSILKVTERVQTLSKDTEERRELLETRVKSWEVFPVQEAKEVKSFVQELENTMNMELDENCSAEELLEQLQRLEVG